MSDIIDCVKHAITTANNDDISEPMTEKRMRHVARVEYMEQAIAEIERLRKGIQNYLDGDWEPKVAKMDKCPHGLYGYEDCVNCIDVHFQRLLAGIDD